MEDVKYLMSCTDIVKTFSGVTVLDHAQLHIRRGEMHALMGENGAGKSTLIKIITGIYPMDFGTICYNGAPVRIHSRLDSQKLGISTVFQELSLVSTLTVAENIMLGREQVGRLGFLDKKSRSNYVQHLIDQYQFNIRANDIVENLSIGQRQTVEILKGLSLDASLIIMDEPTASLTATECGHLFKIIHDLTVRGVSILYISHRLEEVYAHADTITILRDGKYIGNFVKKEITANDIIRHMIGKDISHAAEHAELVDTEGKKPLLEVRDLCVPSSVHHVSFNVYPGEILGISGLMGSGRTETLRAIFGADKSASGEVRLAGHAFRRGSIRTSIRCGLGFVPEDRKSEGFVPMSSVRSNLISPNFDWINRLKVFVNNKKELDTAKKMVSLLDIKPVAHDVNVINLSGGNQQKVVLGKWLARDLKVLLVDEPTAGVDVGAKEEIYQHLRKLQSTGAAVVLVSSDLAELLRISNRIIVLRNGSIVGELMGRDVKEEQLLTIASGLGSEVEA